MTQYGTWVSYGGSAKVVLGIALAGAAGAVAYAGTRVRRPLQAARPGRAVVTFMLASWLLAIATFLVGLGVYVEQAQHGPLAEITGAHATPANPIQPVTFIAVAVVAVVVFAGSGGQPERRLVNAAIAAMAAPMVFELPFDLIVMARTYPPLPPEPGLYRAVFFVPLFLVEITTLALLTLSPMVRLSAATFFCFASMLAVFAIWAFVGFGYPSAPLTITLNVVSKLLAFVTMLSLFFPERLRLGGRFGPRPAQ